MKECILYKKEGKKVKCLACSQKCLIFEGKMGICEVRKNIDGKLFLLVYGKIAAKNIDPIEKKPLYRFLPGSRAFSVGTVGCNMKCEWCQNFDISQASKEGNFFGEDITPEQIVEVAIKTGCKSIAYTYNEPAIFTEFVKDCAILAKKNGLKNILVTNGYFSRESFEFIRDNIDAANIDLKTFNDKTYQKYCGAKLEHVLDNIKWFHDAGIHIEITTLIIPGLNDFDGEFEKIAKFIASVDKNIPWHISRFFPMYKMKDKEITPIGTLKRAEKIGKKYLKYVYGGNV
jgi:pyruvate formate lyase activating enzyme